MTEACLCPQHGDLECPVHPDCACGCPDHAHWPHEPRDCVAGKVGCGCRGYRPKQGDQVTKLKHGMRSGDGPIRWPFDTTVGPGSDMYVTEVTADSFRLSSKPTDAAALWDLLSTAWRQLTDDQRHELASSCCRSCGSLDTRCQCGNDE